MDRDDGLAPGVKRGGPTSGERREGAKWRAGTPSGGRSKFTPSAESTLKQAAVDAARLRMIPY